MRYFVRCGVTLDDPRLAWVASVLFHVTRNAEGVEHVTYWEYTYELTVR